MLTYPHPSVKLRNGGALATDLFYLHREGLGSVRATTRDGGASVERAIYKPFGEQTETTSANNLAPETKGWIGERYDGDAGLQYLNARYYDPQLGMFLQPDWWEVTKKGVGTNRFSYSFNDPINSRDPSGNGLISDIGRAIGDLVRAIGNALTGGTGNPTQGGSQPKATGSNVLINAGLNMSPGQRPHRTVPGGPDRLYTVGCLIDCRTPAFQPTDVTSIGEGGGGGGGGAIIGAVTVTSGLTLLERLRGMTSDGSGTHGNSLMSPKQNLLYHLIERNPAMHPSIAKIGITSADNPPAGRYSEDRLFALGVRFVPIQTYPNRLQARIAEVGAYVAFVATYGSIPRLSLVP